MHQTSFLIVKAVPTTYTCLPDCTYENNLTMHAACRHVEKLEQHWMFVGSLETDIGIKKEQGSGSSLAGIGCWRL